LPCYAPFPTQLNSQGWLLFYLSSNFYFNILQTYSGNVFFTQNTIQYQYIHP
jgi:hypothetical protein